VTEKEKLILAKQQVFNLLNLLKGNQYEQYMNLKLTSVYYELERQLSLCS
jgi:hypothetical protein